MHRIPLKSSHHCAPTACSALSLSANHVERKEENIMALSKKYSKKGTTCKVTFELPFDAAVGAKKVALAGDFNAWNTADTLLKKNYKKRVFSATLELEQGREYQFKYLIDDSRWENDWAADSYAPAPVGGTENSVVIV